jgi:protocatechuate 3,4-dioxygenase beta subunit
MLSSTRQAMACILVVVGVSLCAYSQTAPDEEPTATISGKVTLQGDAVQGVVITLRSNDRKSYKKLMNQRGVTDEKGEYRITNVPPGNYTIIPAAAAFVAASGLTGERTVIVNRADTIENFDFSLTTGGVITGRVVDIDGRPIIEEEIHVFSAREGQRFSPYPAAVTDDRGVYRIFGLKAGSYKVAAGREGDAGASRGQAGVHTRTYYPAVMDFNQASVIQVTERSEAANVDITLSRMLTTYTASGRIVDGNTGQPLANVNWGFKHWTNAGSGSGNAGATSNERGEFKLEGLTPGQYAITVKQRPGSYFRGKDVPFEIVDRDVTGLEVRTSTGASLSGVLVLDGRHDKEIREEFLKVSLFAMVETEETRKTGIIGIQSEVSPNGSFRVGGLPAGNVTFSLGSAQNFTLLRLEQNGIVQVRGVELKQDEDVAGLRIVVGYADASLSGAVELENGPLPPAAFLSVWAMRLNDVSARLGVGAKVDALGRFEFDSLLPGTYEVTAAVFVPGGQRPLARTKQQVVVISGSTSRITLKLNLALPEKSFRSICFRLWRLFPAPPPDVIPALPPDVRRGYATPFNLELGDGLRPRFGLARIFLGQRPNQGPSPLLL